MYNLQHKDLRKLAKWCARWRINLNPEKTKVIIFSRSSRQKLRTHTKTVWQEVQNLSSSEISRNCFRLQIHFPKTLEEILGRCNTRYYRITLLVNKKLGPSPSTILQIYKQCVQSIFEYGSLSTMTTSATIISKIQWLQNKFIRLALRLSKSISVKLLHDSSGLPYVKDRLLSCATRTLDKISKNPSAEESIAFNRVNPAWDQDRKI